MAGQVGTLLQELRTKCGLSLGQLAKAAGVDKSALSRWEAGARQPRIIELEATLDALKATAGQRAAALSRVDAPRAIRRLREIGAITAPGPPPTAGDLLRAMRLRRGWSQEETAQALNVGRTAVTRWERGERLPSTGQIQALCYALCASEAEFTALTTGVFATTPTVLDTRIPWREKEAELQKRLNALTATPPHGLEDLSYLLLQQEIWLWATREDAARALLGQAYLIHAQFSRNQERWAAVGPLLQRAEAAAPLREQTPETLLRLATVKAAYLALGGSVPTPERGVRYLAGWARRSTAPIYTAWILSDMAQYVALQGKREISLSLAEQAYRVAGQAGAEMELHLRRCDFARHLLDAKLPDQALNVLPQQAEGYAHDVARLMLLHVEAHEQSGNRSEAHDWLQRAYLLINACHLEARRRDADALALRF